MRAFVALEINNPEVIDALRDFQKQLAATGADLKLVDGQNLHFTIRFLGDVSQAQSEEVDSRLRSLTLGGAEVEVRGVGAFPNIGRPSVLWVGVASEHEGLVAPIAQSVIRALEGIGQHDDRPFRAHVTLARVRSGRNAPALSSVLRSNADLSFGRVRLSTLKLKSSDLTPRGPVYADIGEYLLA